MLHGSGANQSDTFYRAFVPEIGSALFPRQIELVKRCLKSERGEVDRVGATIFPGLVKVTRATSGSTIEESLQVNTKSAKFDDVLNVVVLDGRSTSTGHLRMRHGWFAYPSTIP
jgi:hypothetical protein